MSPTRDLAFHPGMCPDWESNWRPFDLQASTQSTEPHQPGLFLFLFFFLFIEFVGVIHWLTQLYKFRGHHSSAHHLHTVLCVHRPKSSLLPSPFIPQPSSTSPPPATHGGQRDRVGPGAAKGGQHCWSPVCVMSEARLFSQISHDLLLQPFSQHFPHSYF